MTRNIMTAIPDAYRVSVPRAFEIINEASADILAMANEAAARCPAEVPLPRVVYRMVDTRVALPDNLMETLDAAGETDSHFRVNPYESLLIVPFTGYAQLAITAAALASAGFAVASSCRGARRGLLRPQRLRVQPDQQLRRRGG